MRKIPNKNIKKEKERKKERKKLHCAYRPQSSGQVERMNRTLKKNLAKLILETGRNYWTALLPFALFFVRNTLGTFKLTQYEILYGGGLPHSLK